MCQSLSKVTDKIADKAILFYTLCCVGLRLVSTSREEHRMMVFENRVFRRVAGHYREAVTRGWRIWHNEELYLSYS
jgi:hypothetical protein